MTNLSPAAASIVLAFDDRYEICSMFNENWQEECLAAALRAAADQLMPLTKTPWGSTLIPILTAEESRNGLLAIAAELEALQ